MHVEIQVALNFIISYLYSKLPRRRVNLFGEELEKALQRKFAAHWYPDKPVKGSAFRCIRMSDPMDPVFEEAARESGLDIHDITDNVPNDLTIWIDPGEVSYQIGEKSQVKMLYSESENRMHRGMAEAKRGFNPEAQCFRPIDAATNLLNTVPALYTRNSPAPPPLADNNIPAGVIGGGFNGVSGNGGNKLLGNSTMTTAMFAQTKFGSTKLKTNSKRSHRMSPTEFSNYIKQRGMMQQQQQMHQREMMQTALHSNPHLASMLSPNGSALPPQFPGNRGGYGGSSRPRSLSPNSPTPLDTPNILSLLNQQQYNNNNNNSYKMPVSPIGQRKLHHPHAIHQQLHGHHHQLSTDLVDNPMHPVTSNNTITTSSASFFSPISSAQTNTMSTLGTSATSATADINATANLLDNLTLNNLNSIDYNNSQFHHLLMAN